MNEKAPPELGGAFFLVQGHQVLAMFAIRQSRTAIAFIAFAVMLQHPPECEAQLRVHQAVGVELRAFAVSDRRLQSALPDEPFRPEWSPKPSTIGRAVAAEKKHGTFPLRTLIGAGVGAGVGLLFIASSAEGKVSSWGAGPIMFLAIPTTVGGIVGYILERDDRGPAQGVNR